MKPTRTAQILEARRRAYALLLDRNYPDVTYSIESVEANLFQAASLDDLTRCIVAYAKWKLEIDIRREICRNHGPTALKALDQLSGFLLACRACKKRTLDAIESRYKLDVQLRPVRNAADSA